MKLTLAQTATFVSLWKHWRLDDDDLSALERQVMEHPLAGKVMRDTVIMQKPTKETLGDLLVQSLTEARDGIRGRVGKLTMKTVEIPDPPEFSAAAVHKLCDRLGLSQGLFAKLLGVSRKLVEAWEAGTRTPSPMARRLLGAIARQPSLYVRRRRVA